MHKQLANTGGSYLHDFLPSEKFLKFFNAMKIGSNKIRAK